MLCWLQNVWQPFNHVRKLTVCKSPLSNDITCSFKLFWKESAFSMGIGVVWPETVHGCQQNLWFLYHEFKITNSLSQIQHEVVTSFLRIFMNSFTQMFLFAKLWIFRMKSWGFSACYVANGLYCIWFFIIFFTLFRYHFMVASDFLISWIALLSSLYIYHFSTVIDFSSEKHSGSTGHRNSCGSMARALGL